MRNYWKKHGVTTILVIIFMIGLCLLLYPSFSDYWNSFHQSRAIATYAEQVANMNDEKYKKLMGEAEAYNKSLTETGMRWQMTEEEAREYDSLLDVTGTGIMGYIEIDKIKCSLPIYHGTDDAVLQIAIGHIQGSSLPVGGKGSHCVLSGHRGLPSARLFTDLDQLSNGDTFVIRTMDETMTYEVDNILIVEPDDVGSLVIDPEEDYITLVTCTPYGINTHRLLVRGHRIENLASSRNIRVTADANQIEPIMVAPFAAIPILLMLLVVLMVTTHDNKKRRKEQENKKKYRERSLNKKNRKGDEL
ncbi:MAG: class C sortase [Lachnospiraceae bacterium]|nr:class C sortase [Lachnospiraceae bacterium]